MVATSTLIQILRSLWRLWIQAIPGRFKQALKWLLGRLALYWNTLRSKPGSSAKRVQTNNPPLRPRCSDHSLGKRIGQSDAQQIDKDAFDFTNNYVSLTGGEVISLDDVLPSVYPHSGDGMRSAAQSSKNLEISRSAHSSTVSLRLSRSPSRQSFYGHGSQDAQSRRSSSESINVSIVSPPNSPPADIHSVSYTDNADSTRSHRPLYIHNTNNSSRSLLSPLSVRSDDRLSAMSPTLENEESLPQINDNQNSVNTIDLKSGYDVDQSIHSDPCSTKTSLHQVSHQPLSNLVLGNNRITPVMPEAIDRYSDRPTISKCGPRILSDIQPLTLDYTTPGTPVGWVKYAHPEGACYFFNPEQRIFAEANLHDKTVFDHAMEDITAIQDFIELNKIKVFNSDTELVIHVGKNQEGTLLTSYYFVHHGNRTIFFLDTYQIDNLSVDEEIYGGPSSESHLSHEIETQYWFHCQFYPHSSTLTKAKIQELRDVVLHYIGDSMTSPKGSTAPYSMEELRNILGHTNDMDQNVGGVSVGAHSCLARLMYIFTRARYLHFHGEPHARIERTTSVYGDDVYRRTWLVELLSPILFCSPDFHLKNLQGLWVDEIMHKSVFKDSMERMNSDWDRIVLFATVMLNANVAFLAIQSVDNIGTHVRSSTQIASYVSMISSIGSIVIGLLLSRQNRTKLRETVDEFQKYITSRRHPTLGLETLAILYSLPYALLMWGMIAFFLAVTLLCFLDSDIHTITVVAVTSFFCMSFSLWCVYTNWDEESNEQWKAFTTKIHSQCNNAIGILRPPVGFGRRRSKTEQRLQQCVIEMPDLPKTTSV